MKSAIPFVDLMPMHRFYFRAMPEIIFRKTSSGTYSPIYNEREIRYILDVLVEVFDIESVSQESHT